MRQNVKKLDRKMIESLVLNVQKPARYLGSELNSIVREDVQVRAAISYPDLYDVGMSNNGIRVLYDAANRVDGVACERVFAVDSDMESLLREQDIPLYTLETLTPLYGLDLLGFNLSHELLYTNMLQVLDLGRIPLLSRDRDESSPIVIAGGNAVSNPFPASDFLDAVFMGDGEEGFQEILALIRDLKLTNASRAGMIEELSRLDGILIPSSYTFSFDGSRITHLSGNKVTKRIYRGTSLQNPLKPIVPSIRIAQSRAVYEIARGCGNLCKFCHAGYFELPYRRYPFEEMGRDIFQIMENTGYDELSLSALSISDYMDLAGLLNSILPWLSERGISISLPSMKVDMRTLPIIEGISDLRKTSLTFAVESASEEMRALSNKRVRDDDLYDIVGHVFREGWKIIKLYFMLGLPGCESHDEAESIITMLQKVKYAAGKGSEINVTLSPFVPKPHTPFDREKQHDIEYFNRVIKRVKDKTHRSVKIKNHDVESSMLEGVMSRGDGRLGAVILKSYLDGCRFDSWKEKFHFMKWKRNLDDLAPWWPGYLEARDSGNILPWGLVTTGFERVAASMKEKAVNFKDEKFNVREYKNPLDLKGLEAALDTFRVKYVSVSSARFRVSKRGPARFIPHLDFIEVIKRGCRMAGLPVAFSRGFNKREKISFGVPIPLGIESESELFDIELFDEMPRDVESRLKGKFPPGIEFRSWRHIDSRESLMSMTMMIGYRLVIGSREIHERIAMNLAGGMAFKKIAKNGTVRDVAFNMAVVSFEVLDEAAIRIRLHAGSPESIRIDRLVMDLAGISSAGFPGIEIIKESQHRGDGSEID